MSKLKQKYLFCYQVLGERLPAPDNVAYFVLYILYILYSGSSRTLHFSLAIKGKHSK